MWVSRNQSLDTREINQAQQMAHLPHEIRWDKPLIISKEAQIIRSVEKFEAAKLRRVAQHKPKSVQYSVSE
jgi:hypothetical protein